MQSFPFGLFMKTLIIMILKSIKALGGQPLQCDDWEFTVAVRVAITGIDVPHKQYLFGFASVTLATNKCQYVCVHVYFTKYT